MRDKYKILVVNEEELDAIKNLQELETYKIETISRAIKAFEKVKSEKHHSALTDIGMADMDGLELLKKIKTYDALTQIVMMSNYSTMEKILNSLEFAANDNVANPFGNLEEAEKIINYSIEKIERWRESTIEIVK
jgi:DNA-binding NtrC family response regulator